MNKLKCLISFIALFNVCVSYANASNDDLTEIFETLNHGDQIEFSINESSPEHVFESGLSKYKAFKLPISDINYQIVLRSYINKSSNKSGLFYAGVMFLDENGGLNRLVINPIELDNLGIKGYFSFQSIEVTEADRYMVVFTPEKIINKSFGYLDQNTTTTPLITGGSMYVIPGRTTYYAKGATFTDTGEFELMLPYQGYQMPLARQDKFYWSIGYSYGGETLANATDQGDDFRAGGGLLISAGWAVPVFNNPYTNIRTSFGYQYDNGDTNLGDSTLQTYVADASLMYSTKEFNIGIGLNYHISPELNTSLPGTSQIFDDAFGTQIILEMRGSETISVGMRFVSMDYTNSITKNNLNANQLGFFLHIFH